VHIWLVHLVRCPVLLKRQLLLICHVHSGGERGCLHLLPGRLRPISQHPCGEEETSYLVGCGISEAQRHWNFGHGAEAGVESKYEAESS
jgi:hypothetical protein